MERVTSLKRSMEESHAWQRQVGRHDASLTGALGHAGAGQGKPGRALRMKKCYRRRSHCQRSGKQPQRFSDFEDWIEIDIVNRRDVSLSMR